MSKEKICFLLFLLLTCSGFAQKNKFNFNVSGEGEPIIIIVTAMGEDLKSWRSNQRRLSSLTKVVTYDRLGIGKSEPTDDPRTVANLANELDEFVTSNEIKGPYLLIGHSLGAFIVRKYQNVYPEKVLGMILIDPVHEQQFDSLMVLKSEEDKDRTEKEREAFVNNLPKGQRNEAMLYHEQRWEMMNVRLPNDIPVTILASFRVGPGVTREERQLKRRLIEGWVKVAPQIKLVSTEKSGHYIQDSEPELLIEEVKVMIQTLRN